MATFEAADDGDLILPRDAALVWEIERRRNPNGGPMVALAFVFWIRVARDRIVGYPHFWHPVPPRLPLGPRKGAAIIEQRERLAQAKRKSIGVSGPRIGDPSLNKTFGLGGRTLDAATADDWGIAELAPDGNVHAALRDAADNLGGQHLWANSEMRRLLHASWETSRTMALSDTRMCKMSSFSK